MQQRAPSSLTLGASDQLRLPRPLAVAKRHFLLALKEHSRYMHAGAAFFPLRSREIVVICELQDMKKF